MSILMKVFAVVIGVDGLLAASLGHKYLGWLAEKMPRQLRPVVRFFLKWPAPALRLASLAQALVGFGWLAWQLQGEDDTEFNLEEAAERSMITA